jgi:hypothetical protein
MVPTPPVTSTPIQRIEPVTEFVTWRFATGWAPVSADFRTERRTVKGTAATLVTVVGAMLLGLTDVVTSP